LPVAELAMLMVEPPTCTDLLLQGVRQKNFNKVKEQIENNLFLAKPTFAPHLREICEWDQS
jgi:hypothetical protein